MNKFAVVSVVLALTLSSCASLTQWLSVSTVPVNTVSEARQTLFLQQQQVGQLDVVWPQNSSSRALVNNRAGFIGYRQQGYLLLDIGAAQEIELRVNQYQFTLRPAADLGKYLKLDISKLTKNGVNQLELVSLKPLGASVRIIVPFPELQNGTPEQTGFDISQLAELDELITRDVAQGFPGAVLVVIKDGIVIKQSAYGYASKYHCDGQLLNTPNPMQTDTVFDLASNTKMYATNFALMHLMSKGLLDVNKPVSAYLAEYKGDGREQRLVKDLLTHTAGYAPEVHFHRPDNQHGAMFYSLDRDRTMQLLATAVPFATERATQAVYSDTDYMLLGMIVERLTGQPLDTFVEQTFYQPMGLQRTVFNPLRKGVALTDIAATELNGNSRGGRISFPANVPGVVRGYVHDEKARYAFDGVAGHAGLFSTAGETAQLAFTALHGGYGLQRFFNADVLQQFVRPSVEDANFGLGWRTAVNKDMHWLFGPYASQYAFGHSGWTGTVTLVDPAYNLVVVLLTNKKHSAIIDAANSGYYFAGDRFETGMYGSIMSKIYQAMQ